MFKNPKDKKLWYINRLCCPRRLNPSGPKTEIGSSAAQSEPTELWGFSHVQCSWVQLHVLIRQYLLGIRWPSAQSESILLVEPSASVARLFSEQLPELRDPLGKGSFTPSFIGIMYCTSSYPSCTLSLTLSLSLESWSKHFDGHNFASGRGRAGCFVTSLRMRRRLRVLSRTLDYEPVWHPRQALLMRNHAGENSLTNSQQLLADMTESWWAT